MRIFKVAGFVLGCSVLIGPTLAQAGMADVPGWMRGTNWSGHATGCGHSRVNLHVHIYDDARYVLRATTSRDSFPSIDGIYGGYINMDVLAGKMQFNPETDFSWFRGGSWGVSPAALKAWDTWGFPYGTDSISGSVSNCGTFNIHRVYQ